jgi:hypothetical protein
MIKKTFLTALLGASLLLGACKKNPTALEPEPVPGRRDYIWQLDTLDMPMNYIASVWGASPNDVWAVGAGGTYQDRLLHYDGVKWSTYNKEPIWCTGNTLFGFSSNDVWMGGGGGWLAHGAGIWHYDGVTWSQYYVYDIKGSYLMQVQDLWGTSRKDIYASGLIVFKEGQTDNVYGFVLHFDGRRWQEVVKGPLNTQFVRIRKERNNLYVQSYRNGTGSNDSEAWVFYEIDGDELKEIYSTPNGGLNLIDGKTYFVIGDDVCRYLGGSLVKQFSFHDPQFNSTIYGRNQLDLFVSMKNGIAHYNGDDMEYLYKYPQAHMGNINVPIIFNNEVFFCILNPRAPNATNLILHGRLKE